MLTKEDIQIQMENKCNRKQIREVIYSEYQEQIDELIAEGRSAVSKYLSGSYYASKECRLEELAKRDIDSLIKDLIVEILLVKESTSLNSVVGTLCRRLGFEEMRDNIVTMSELVAVLEVLDIYELNRNIEGVITLRSKVTLCSKMQRYLKETGFMLPMIVKPLILEGDSTGYITVKDSLVLGKGSKEKREVCKDSLEIFNSIALELDTDFLKTVSIPEKEFKNKQDDQNYKQFIKERYAAYKYLVGSGNEFYLTHRVDKRGRTYSYGYHVTTQGDSFNKAVVDLKHKEIVEIPDEYKREVK